MIIKKTKKTESIGETWGSKIERNSVHESEKWIIGPPRSHYGILNKCWPVRDTVTSSDPRTIWLCHRLCHYTMSFFFSLVISMTSGNSKQPPPPWQFSRAAVVSTMPSGRVGDTVSHRLNFNFNGVIQNVNARHVYITSESKVGSCLSLNHAEHYVKGL